MITRWCFHTSILKKSCNTIMRGDQLIISGLTCMKNIIKLSDEPVWLKAKDIACYLGCLAVLIDTSLEWFLTLLEMVYLCSKLKSNNKITHKSPSIGNFNVKGNLWVIKKVINLNRLYMRMMILAFIE